MITELRTGQSIPCIVSQKTIQKDCKLALKQLVDEIKKRYGKKINSIYLYGSFSEGRGTIGSSDLDLAIITNEKIDLHSLKDELSKKYGDSFVDIGIESQTKSYALEDKYGWSAFLKLFCVCVYGKDISQSLPEYYVTKELVAGFIEDTEKLVKDILKYDNSINKKRIAKLIIRRTYYAELENHLKWTTILEEQLKIIQTLFPDHKENFIQVYEQTKGQGSLEEKELKRLIAFTLNLVNKHAH